MKALNETPKQNPSGDQITAQKKEKKKTQKTREHNSSKVAELFNDQFENTEMGKNLEEIKKLLVKITSDFEAED